MRLLLAEFIAVGAVACALTGCKSSAPESQRHARSALPEADGPALAAGLSAEEIGSARKLYQNKCARCHKFYNPKDYGDAEWGAWMVKMTKKARLKADQAQLLSRYLEAFRDKRNAVGKSAE